MLGLLLLAAAAPQSVIDADRALAAAMVREGEYAALLRFAGPGAIYFHGGEPLEAREALSNRQEPARPLRWHIAESITSCDGTTAYTIGSALLSNGRPGTLLLIWQRQPDRTWRWVAWKGFATGREMAPDSARVRAASCMGSPPFSVVQRPPTPWGRLQSPDRTFIWEWVQIGRTIRTNVRVWNGNNYATAAGEP